MKQSVHFVTTRDQVRIAYGISGEGPPVVKTPNWLTHLEYDLRSPGWVHWIEFLSSRWRLLRCDQRGSGLSDRNVSDVSFDRWVDDLDAVVRTAGLERFTLLGISQGGAVAVEYAARYPQKVDRLVLLGSYARGWAMRDDPLELRQARAMLELVETGWGSGNPAYRQLFTSLFMPDASTEESRWFNELQGVSASPAMAARLIEAAGRIDVSGRLADVRVPTMVLHARHDARVPFEEGRNLAAGIPGARFVTLESRNHVLLEHDRAWQEFRDAFESFVPTAAGVSDTVPFTLQSLTRREREVFHYVLKGCSNGEIASALHIHEKTVRNHLTSIFSKLHVKTRAQAIVSARNITGLS